jgi:cob(I)alamin adenosyltransferase
LLGADCNELIIVYTGNGKGKTTAALGAALRALGHGKKVHIVYFIKGSGPNAEQVAMSKLPDISFSRFGKKGFVDPDNVTPEDREEAQKSFLAAQEAVVSGN